MCCWPSFCGPWAGRGSDAAPARHRLGATVLAADIGATTPLANLAPVVDAHRPSVQHPARRQQGSCGPSWWQRSAHWQARYESATKEILKGAVDKAAAMVSGLPLLGEKQLNGHTPPEHVGELIRAERERQGLSQNQLGRRIDASQSELSRLEGGLIQAGPVRDRALRVPVPRSQAGRRFGHRGELRADHRNHSSARGRSSTRRHFQCLANTRQFQQGPVAGECLRRLFPRQPRSRRRPGA